VTFDVHEPTTLGEALSTLKQEGEAGAVLAGGTDLLLRIRRRARKYRAVINIKFVPGLTGITWNERDGLTLGALTTFRALELDPTVCARYPALAQAARVVAGVQLRNLATIGGNLGNASPSADSVPPLVDDAGGGVPDRTRAYAAGAGRSLHRHPDSGATAAQRQRVRAL
jgi:CO/xanthine dehydrogenase FAD-binding subunit